MNDFNISFQTKEGRIDIYEGVEMIVICQEGRKIKIPLSEWKSLYSAIELANQKRRKV